MEDQEEEDQEEEDQGEEDQGEEDQEEEDQGEEDQDGLVAKDQEGGEDHLGEKGGVVGRRKKDGFRGILKL